MGSKMVHCCLSLSLGLVLPLTTLALSFAVPPEPVSAHEAAHNSGAPSAQASHIAGDWRALWKKPSQAFKEAVSQTGIEPVDQTTAKLKAFLGNPFSTLSGAEKHAAAYALARILARSSDSGEQKQALDLFRQAQQLSCLRMPALWHQHEIIAKASPADEKALQDLLNTIIKDSQAKSEDLARAHYELAQSYLRSNNSETARQTLLALQEGFPSSEFARAANYYLGQMAMQSQSETGNANLSAAQNYFHTYLKATTGGRFSQDVADKLVEMSSQLPLSPEDTNLVGLVYFKKGNYNKALTYLSKTNSDLFRIAQCQAKLKQRPEALETLFKAIIQDPASSNFEDYVSNITDPMTRAETKEVWAKILALPVKPRRLDQVLWNIALRSEDQQAIPLFSRLVKEFPTSEYAPESMWWIFWHQTKQIYGQINASKTQAMQLAAFADSAAARFPKHRSAARFLYWSGKLHEKLNDRTSALKHYEQAAIHYPANYYGARARSRINLLNQPADKKHDRGWSTFAARQHVPQNWDWPGPEQLFDMDTIASAAGARTAVLATIRQFDEAIGALEAARSEAPESFTRHRDNIAGFKAWAYLSQALPLEAIRAAGSDLDGHPNRGPLWQITYPFAYCALINEQARLRKVDPYLAHALIREESRYFPGALSRSNAIGLMQLLPGTAFGVAKHINLPITSKEDVFVPENNIKLGTAYLAHTLERFNGNAMLAIASYNGGPNAVKRWVDQFQAKKASNCGDWDVFVEDIPYRETRDYVRKVFGSFFVYELLY